MSDLMVFFFNCFSLGFAGAFGERPVRGLMVICLPKEALIVIVIPDPKPRYRIIIKQT